MCSSCSRASTSVERRRPGRCPVASSRCWRWRAPSSPIFEIIRTINAQGTPVLLVEQNALMALDTAHRGYVMETGRITLAGPASQLKTNEAVRKAYLGVD